MTITTDQTTYEIHIPQWLMKSNGFASRKLTGVVLRTTDRGIQVRAHALVREADNCHRCGREIDNPASRLVGYGPDCSEKLGIPRDFPDEMLAEVIRRATVASTVECWLPLSHVTVFGADGQPVRPADIALAAPADAAPAAVAAKGGTPAPAAQRKPVWAVETVDGDFWITSPFASKDALKEALRPRWSQERKQWRCRATPSAAEAIVKLIGDEPNVKLDAGFEAALAQAEQRREVAVHKSADESDLPPVPNVRLVPWVHQARAFHFGVKLDALALFVGMGGGKTKITIDILNNRPHTRRVLILCPRNVVGVWPREFRKHGVRPVDACAPRKGTVERKAGEVQAFLSVEHDDLCVVAVNYESAWREPMAKTLLAQQWDLVILDESHRVKAPGGKASQFTGRLGQKAKERIILTGTPMPHSPLDVYAQYRFLDSGVFGTSFAAFRSRYAIMGGYGGHEVMGFQRQEELHEKMFSVAYRIADEELDAILGLEEPVHVNLTCELEPAARKVYEGLLRDLEADLTGDGEEVVSAANALVRLLRLQQVTSGFVPVETDDSTEDEKVLRRISTAKADLLADVLADVPEGEKVVVFCRFQPELDAIREVVENADLRYGELSGRARDGLTEDAEMNPDIDVLGCQIQAGGVGIDLTAARFVVYLSTGHNMGDYEQSLKRSHRPGQKHRVTYYHLLCENTIDEGVQNALANRKSLVDFVLGGLAGGEA